MTNNNLNSCHDLSEISDGEFDATIAKYRIPVLVEFWKPGCPHCQALIRELAQLAMENPRTMKIFKINVEENRLIAGDLEIVSLPALALFMNGEFQQFIGGIGKKKELLDTLKPWISGVKWQEEE